MENYKEIIAANLVALRKSRKMTQQDLAEKLNYSDKAISRWEHAETLPDIETLCKICEIYGVRFEYLLQKEQPKVNNPYIVRTNTPIQILIMFIAICSVWIGMLFVYIYVDTILSKNLWTLFIWAIPLSAFVAQVYNRLYFGNRTLKCVMHSVFMWSLLLSFYLEMLEYNIWMLFIVGIPIQAVIISMTILKIKSGDVYTPRKEIKK
jgi:transcriptional regulator with XRE-family HTH domain